MKNHLFSVLIFLLSSIVILPGCKTSNEFGDKEKLAISDTINQLMDEVSKYAAMANADSTLQYLSDDSAAVFISGAMAYNAREILSQFKNAYASISSQEFEKINSQVVVLSPDAALWIGTLKEKVKTKSDDVLEHYLFESWLWRREAGGWKVAHYHESILPLPDACKKATVESALQDLAGEVKKALPKPSEIPAILTSFLKQNPLVYGAAFAFAPTESNGTKQYMAPYVYRSGSEFKQVNLPEAYDYTVSGWYAEPVSQKKATWSEPYFDDGGGGVVMVTYSIPIFDAQDNLFGVLTSDVELK